jgi:hypothetical protein
MSVFQAKQAVSQGSGVDVAAEMRRGHVGIEDTDRTLLGIFREHFARRAGDPPLRIFDICSGSGFFIRRLLRELPDAARHELIAHEDEPGCFRCCRHGWRWPIGSTPGRSVTGASRSTYC